MAVHKVLSNAHNNTEKQRQIFSPLAFVLALVTTVAKKFPDRSVLFKSMVSL